MRAASRANLGRSDLCGSGCRADDELALESADGPGACVSIVIVRPSTLSQVQIRARRKGRWQAPTLRPTPPRSPSKDRQLPIPLPQRASPASGDAPREHAERPTNRRFHDPRLSACASLPLPPHPRYCCSPANRSSPASRSTALQKCQGTEFANCDCDVLRRSGWRTRLSASSAFLFNLPSIPTIAVTARQPTEPCSERIESAVTG
jgi:hypothetical protein